MKSDINDLCEAFLAALTNAGYAVKSIENYKQVSNRFKKFCAENGYDTYTVNIGQIFADNVFNEETGAFVGYRNVMYGRFVRLLLYDTGARVQELADLDIESLHLDVPNPYISSAVKLPAIKQHHPFECFYKTEEHLSTPQIYHNQCRGQIAPFHTRVPNQLQGRAFGLASLLLLLHGEELPHQHLSPLFAFHAR